MCLPQYWGKENTAVNTTDVAHLHREEQNCGFGIKPEAEERGYKERVHARLHVTGGVDPESFKDLHRKARKGQQTGYDNAEEQADRSHKS